ncbi:ribonuclease HII [Parazoarcus communis]|uniref:Ribonuclease HII n=1 Tax=Parazoarcus communis SWub3 = DSM 12120 TaxID=1121029 RepID=A0A323UVW7_9RHOO|nr:ribonuclease HII [Parazoarcus communis]NMG71028.1 ribonuclease HII [Parazoarcus communis SWub3 = DSM 12120]PZA15376.1 ribonuclease HII [Azoarcus communis] [Parazoarcus communis SWub3 = DSM 12120]
MSRPEGIRLICGVDEAGRGPLCGAVVAAAVILDPTRPIDGLNDSKKLSEKARDRLALLIRERALAWAVAEASVAEIDRLNILHASMLAMKRAVEALTLRPDEVLIDGNRCPDLALPMRAIVQGDALEPSISAASILAKTVRDEQMRELDRQYPQFGLAGHKGYPTAAHLAAIRRHGVPDFYRRSFAPVRKILDNPPLWTEDET